MNAQKIKNRLGEVCTLFAFKYEGKDGNIDPCYITAGKSEFLLYFNGAEQTVYSLDDAMCTPFVDGQCLNNIADKIEIIEW